MRPVRVLAAVTAVSALLLGATGCTGAEAEAGGSASAAEAGGSASAAEAGGSASATEAGGSASATEAGGSASATEPPVLAGSAEAEALAPLPAGPATGTAVLAYSGVGEVRAPFSGECAHAEDTTLLDGSADTARIRLEVGPDGARLALEDQGLTATSDLTAGRYDVSGAHLTLDAGLTQDGLAIGSVRLEIDCGG